MTENTPLLSVNQLTVKYRSIEVLKDVDFSVEPGDYLAVVGPNGSGKTTLIKALLGLISPSSGNIEMLGEDLASFGQWNRIGYLPQVSRSHHGRFPATIREIIGTGLLAQKQFPKRLNADDQRKVDDVLELLQITDLADRMIGRLSGGQQQRALLARAMVAQPDVLILDEPTVALDPETRTRFYETIKSLNDNGTSILLITHDSGTVGQYANKFLYLDRKVVFFGNFGEFCHSGDMAKYFGDQQHLICHQH